MLQSHDLNESHVTIITLFEMDLLFKHKWPAPPFYLVLDKNGHLTIQTKENQSNKIRKQEKSLRNIIRSDETVTNWFYQWPILDCLNGHTLKSLPIADHNPFHGWMNEQKNT